MAVETDTRSAGFHVASADDDHGVDFGGLCANDLLFDRVGAEIGFATGWLAEEIQFDCNR